MADKFWVGGSGNWDDVSTANWSDTSGGAGGAVIPGGADNAIFDANSGAGIVTLYPTLAPVRGVSMNSDDITLDLSDDIVLLPSVRSLGFQKGVINLNSYSLSIGLLRADFNNARTINFGTGKIVVTGLSGTVLAFNFGAQLTLNGSKRIELDQASGVGTRTIYGALTTQNGTENNTPDVFILNGSDIVSVGANLASGFRTLDFTGFSGSISGTSSGKTIFGDLIFSPTMTASGFASGFIFAGVSAPRTIDTKGITLGGNVNFDGIGGVYLCGSAFVLSGTLTLINGTVKLKDGANSIVNTFATSGTNQKFLESTLAGSQATLSQASGTVNAANLTIKDINATGGATWNAFTTNGNIDGGNNVGWDFNQLQIGRYIFNRRKNKRILP